MKQFFIAILMVFLSTVSVFSQSVKCVECKQILDTTISIMKKEAINSKKVNWKKVSDEAQKLSQNATNPYDLEPSFIYLFKSIGDFHGAFFYGDSTFKWKYNEPFVNDSIRTALSKGAKIKTGIIDKTIGYLRIPSIPAFSINDFNVRAQQLNDSLCFLLDKNIEGLIIDLRLNGGGAMQPMILGTEQLLKQGKVGSSYTTNEKEDWIIKDNKFFADSMVIASISPKCKIDGTKIPIVILTSPITGSAAECLIIAYKGRSNTILLGTTTAGYLTVNNGYGINENAGMNLSIGYNSDRNGRIYKKAFKPDIRLNSLDNFSNIENDAKVKAAVKWLNTKIKQTSK